MSVNETHKLIDRPRGIPGYRPSQWCSVCGKAARGEDANNCKGLYCQNKCHKKCLADLEAFDCMEVAALRTIIDIADPVVYIEQLPDIQVTEISEDILSEDTIEKNRLQEKSKEELIEEIIRLKKEASASNSLANELKNICKTIASKRDALVEALDFVDTLTATVNSIEEKSTTTIACSAIPQVIDREWQERTEAHPHLENWWETQKPKRLRSEKVPASQIKQSIRENDQRPSPPYSRKEVKPDVKISQQRREETRAPSKPSVRKKQPTQTSRKHFSKTQPLSCSICFKRGHVTENCYSRANCNYCGKKGHKEDICRTRIADEKQKSLFNALLTEQANQTAAIIRSLQSAPSNQAVPSMHNPMGEIPWTRGFNTNNNRNSAYNSYPIIQHGRTT